MSNINDAELALDELKDICARLGWDVLIDLDSESIFGIIVGTGDFIQSVIDGQEDLSEHTYVSTEESGEILH